MMKNENNGWSNKQTWHIQLVYGMKFIDMCKDESFDDLERLANTFQSLVNKFEIENLKYFGVMQPGNLAHQLVENFLDKVNWMEIVKFYVNLFQQA